MLDAFVVVEFWLDASIRPSLTDISPGHQSTAVQKYGFVD